ncbi:MAG: 50S ribosomal protein L6 [candidate division WOR-3 bacterium]
MMPIGKRPITIPPNVKVELKDSEIFVSGPLGQLNMKIHPQVDVILDNNQIVVKEKSPKVKNFRGLMWALINNMIIGVTKGFEKILEVRGQGYRAQKTKEGIQLFVGFSHPVNFSIPQGIDVDIRQAPNPDDPKTPLIEIVVKGIDKYLVGQVAANIRKIKPPDRYKGKGIRYKGEIVKLKPGKKAVTTT